MTAMLPAQGTATYVIAGYLPETVNNAYQGQHFHGKLVLNAYQMDDTGAGKPDEGGSSSTDPEDPDRFEDVYKRQSLCRMRLWRRRQPTTMRWM